MKTLITTLFFLLLSNSAFTSEKRSVSYWCDPQIRLTGLEAVLISEINGEKYIEVYTESRGWGGIDKKVEKADLRINEDGGENYTSSDATVSLEIFTIDISDNLAQNFYRAHFADMEFGFDMKMICEALY